jgi:hypothetical protein
MHASSRSTIIEGKTTAEVAGLGNNNNEARLENVYECIPQELVREMAQHGLHPQMIAAPIRQRWDELEQSAKKKRRVGGEEKNTGRASSHFGGSARERALQTAERRAWEQQKQQQQQQPEQNHDKDQDKEGWER